MADILQLNPPIPVVTPYGDGYAHLIIDYGQEHHIYWVVAQDSTGEFWTWENPKIRIQNNVTLNRPKTQNFGGGLGGPNNWGTFVSPSPAGATYTTGKP
jgi:hypothetical protein